MDFNNFKSQYSAIESKDIDLQIGVLKTVPRFFNDEDNVEIDKPVSIEELQGIISKMAKEKCHGPNGWTHGLFHTFSDIMGED
jgi:hypothetical protein